MPIFADAVAELKWYTSIRGSLSEPLPYGVVAIKRGSDKWSMHPLMHNHYSYCFNRKGQVTTPNSSQRAIFDAYEACRFGPIFAVKVAERNLFPGGSDIIVHPGFFDEKRHNGQIELDNRLAVW